MRKGTMRSGFRYTDHTGKAIIDNDTLERIRSLVIPPAWKMVRIAVSPRTSIQAVGMDTTGRVQYIYEAAFAERQQKKKFERIEEVGRYLPALRRRTNKDILLKGAPREKVLAVMMRLINELYIRTGTDKSAETYKTFGITTLRNKHLKIERGGKLIFDFVGKSHIKHRKVLVDEKLAAILKELKQLKGGKLFKYLDENGKIHPIKPADVNAYIKEATADQFTSKDLRTWGATLLAAEELAEIGVGESETDVKRNVVKAVKKVAEDLGNTPAVCRGSYIHPKVIKAYENGVTLDAFRPRKMRRIGNIQAEYEKEEKALLKLLK